MKIQKYLEFINEKMVFNKYPFTQSEDSYIISKGKYIYSIPKSNENSNLENDLRNLLELNLELNLDEEESIYDIIIKITEERPDIILLEWEKDDPNIITQVNHLEFTPDPFVSKELRDTLKFLKTKYKIETLKIYTNEKYDEFIYYNIQTLLENKNKLPHIVYHGTSSKYLKSIMRFGIKSNKSSSNFTIEHTNYIFFSSNILDCKFYAQNSISSNGGVPIILEIDTNGLNREQIIFDYDYYSMHIDLDFRLKKINPPLPFNPLGSTYSKFGYNGTLYPKWIKKIWFQSTPEIGMEDNYEESIYDDWIEGPNYQILLNRINWYENVGLENMYLSENDFNSIKSDFEENN